ncbi:twin-arginine translocase TatA/TatE family subunit [Oceanicella actignis]|uniref:Sec-independent protein translocase protein TatA n=1 Tax=Oceanicella actignis TaxID=1189325 RepID=A0A1M7RWE5_9RHOB|nr:twin-arginine translocase TatA/TatE family subunit [Oceanicella actignis]TYO89957.1 sec-independent protein translocase protein TatA [Oceanicella actignis]SES99958.1 sec-independent protein translocase protein TatA [Oceanicella actignis]SHN50550.1 sec-independent protein translocase protein TatA [Oceanicella actignis]
MSPSIWQILIVVLLVVVLFGRGKISGLMGDVAKGIKSFKKGLAEDDEPQKVADERRAEDGKVIDVTPSAEAQKKEG